MQESMALDCPADTVLSGPAASVIGAAALTGAQDAVICDMGGTTSDIAFLENGRALINPDGAAIDCWRTHIRGANLYTFGIGGDSFLRLQPGGLLEIGPERVEPLCVSSHKNPEILPVLDQMRTQGRDDLPLYYLSGKSTHGIRMSPSDRRVFEAISRPCTEGEMCRFVEQEALAHSLRYLVSAGLIVKTGLTPTDLKHAERTYLEWDHRAADIGADILSKHMGVSREAFLARCACEIEQRIVQLCRESILTHYGQVPPRMPPMIGIGAPAKAWLPSVAEVLGAEWVLPENSDVANAIGAALCPIRESAGATIRFHKERNVYTLFLPDQRLVFSTLESAEAYVSQALGKYAEERARRAGGVSISVKTTQARQYIEGEFIQSTFLATAEEQRFGCPVRSGLFEDLSHS